MNITCQYNYFMMFVYPKKQEQKNTGWYQIAIIDIIFYDEGR